MRSPEYNKYYVALTRQLNLDLYTAKDFIGMGWHEALKTNKNENFIMKKMKFKKIINVDNIIHYLYLYYPVILTWLKNIFKQIDPRIIGIKQFLKLSFLFIFTILIGLYCLYLAQIDHDANVKSIQPVFSIDYNNPDSLINYERLIINYYGITQDEITLNDFPFLDIRYRDPITRDLHYAKLPLGNYYGSLTFEQKNLKEGSILESARVSYNFINRIRKWFYDNVDENVRIETSSYIIIKYSDAYGCNQEKYFKFNDNLNGPLLEETKGKELLIYYNEKLWEAGIPYIPDNESSDIDELCNTIFKNSIKFADIYDFGSI